MTSRKSGRYPIERRKGEIERLLVQAQALATDAEIMLGRIGVAAGWRCLDLGCGPVGITGLLSKRVGVAGRVLGLDADPVFLDYARREAPANVAFVEGDAYRTGLEAASFDFVHVRFLASTAGAPESLVREAMRLARRGGVVAFQEPDVSSLKCYPPLPAWDRLGNAIAAVFTAIGGDTWLGQKLYGLLCAVGLKDVEYRPFVVGVRPGDPLRDFLPSTVDSMRSALLEHRIMSSAELDAALAECRAHLARPDVVFNLYTTVQVWGRVP